MWISPTSQSNPAECLRQGVHVRRFDFTIDGHRFRPALPWITNETNLQQPPKQLSRSGHVLRDADRGDRSLSVPSPSVLLFRGTSSTVVQIQTSRLHRSTLPRQDPTPKRKRAGWRPSSPGLAVTGFRSCIPCLVAVKSGVGICSPWLARIKTTMLKNSPTSSALHDEADWAARISYITSRCHKAFARRAGYSGEWLCTPNPALEGQTPLEAVTTDRGFEAVKGLLTKIEQGLYT